MAIAQQGAAYVRAENADPQLLALKVPPHSIEAEQSLLGALLLDNQAFDRVADLVTGDDFYQRHQAYLIAATIQWSASLAFLWSLCAAESPPAASYQGPATDGSMPPR